MLDMAKKKFITDSAGCTTEAANINTSKPVGNNGPHTLMCALCTVLH